MSKPYRDPVTGKFTKKPAKPSVPPPCSAANTSSRLLLISPTPRSCPIPGSFDSPSHTPDDSITKTSTSPSKFVPIDTFFNAFQHMQDRSPNPTPPVSQITTANSVPLDDTETLVPISRSIVDSLARLIAQESQEPLPTFAYTQPSPLQLASTSSSSTTPSTVSSVSASQLSSPALAPQTASPTPAFAPLSTLHPPCFQSQLVPPPSALLAMPPLINSQQPPTVSNPPPHVPTPQPVQLALQPLAQPPLPPANPPPALAPTLPPQFNAAPPAPPAPPAMANNTTGLAAMPGPHLTDAPYFSKTTTGSFTDFMHEYQALATANSLTDAQKVETILRYVSPDLHKFWKTVDGFTANNWAMFSTALEAMYLDTSAAT